jgi:DNA (cytosine-5)-methyltransferase 1
MTYGDLFTGFGGSCQGAINAGLTPVFGLEKDAAIAEVTAANFSHQLHVADICDCNPRTFERVDILHASPPCPSFSVASQGKETAVDIALARKVAEFVTVLRPRIFTLENVIAYRHSKSWHIVEAALQDAGYWLHVAHCNAADFGVAQTRKRMIVRAVQGGFVPYLPVPVPWVGWYAAIEDILHTLPESRFAKWQLARLPALLMTTLVGSGGFNGKIVTVEQGAPSFTVTANQNQLVVRAWLLDTGSVVAMTPRALARFQSFPDSYILSGNAQRDARGIGNAVPPLLYQRILEGLLNA